MKQQGRTVARYGNQCSESYMLPSRLFGEDVDAARRRLDAGAQAAGMHCVHGEL